MPRRTLTVVALEPVPASDRRRLPAPSAGVTDRIVESVIAGIIERRLKPGTKLGEQKIATLFGVSRTIVRQALNQLSRDRLVTLEPGRGAFVATPSIDEAHHVFEYRAMIETELVKQLCARVTSAQIKQLRAHLRDTKAAVARTDVAGRTRLLADFHVELARLLGNHVLVEAIADLLSRSALISLMYQSTHAAEESHQEHERIVDAIEGRDARAAARLMTHHLDNLERNLRLNPRAPTNLEQALRPDKP